MPAFSAHILGNLLQVGTVAAVDLAAATCKVKLGAITTGPLPWLARAGALSLWAPPVVGEQCLLLSPEGDMRRGIVLPGLYSNAHPAPASAARIFGFHFDDGAVLSYDAASHQLSIALSSGTVQVAAPDGLTITGDVNINGNVAIDGDASLTGTLAADQDVTADGVSLTGHHHKGVQTGTGESGGPV